jgi:hypothetical protein
VSSQLTAVLRDRRVLLILDDIWQVEHALPFRVGGQQCSLIMTSRLYDVTTALAPTAGDIYRLPVLTEQTGLELLWELAPQVLVDEPTAARELVQDWKACHWRSMSLGELLLNEAHLGWGLRELLTELRSGATCLKHLRPATCTARGRGISYCGRVAAA